MTASNHAMTGALIGLLLPQPLIAVPLAIASHFICDAIPHFGGGDNAISSRWFKRLLQVDALGCLLLVIVLAVMQPVGWPLAILAAFLAASPDIMWLPKFLHARHGHDVTWHEGNPVLWFHTHIQWFERPIGAAVEVAWAAACIFSLTLILP